MITTSAGRALQPASSPPVVSVQSEAFDLTPEYEALRRQTSGAGAIVSFTGLVRDLNLSDDVIALELEHYPGMTEKFLERIARQAIMRFGLHAARVIHRVGRLQAGDPIVLVLTASAHRREAFEACEFIMDYLKSEAPFWKKEWTAAGPRWLDQRVADREALVRWRPAA